MKSIPAAKSNHDVNIRIARAQILTSKIGSCAVGLGLKTWDQNGLELSAVRAVTRKVGGTAADLFDR